MARCLVFSFSRSLAISLAALSFAGCMSSLGEAPLTEPADEQAIPRADALGFDDPISRDQG